MGLRMRSLYSVCPLSGTGGCLCRSFQRAPPTPVIDGLGVFSVRHVCLATLQWSANRAPRAETSPSHFAALSCNLTGSLQTETSVVSAVSECTH